MDVKSVKVGVGVIIIKDGRVLLGKRKSKNGFGTWSFPGGHLEYGESFEDCARREVFEETGLEIRNIRQARFTSDVFYGNHYVTLYVACDYASGQIQDKEPDKNGEWTWFKWNEFPQPIFNPIESLLKMGYDPFK